MHKRFNLLKLLVWRKSIFYVALQPIKAYKLLLLHSTCLWRSPSCSVGIYVLVGGMPVSTHVPPDVYAAQVAHSCICSKSQGHSGHTVTILQAHPSTDLCFPPSIHVLKHITEMTAFDEPLFPLAQKSHYCAVYASGVYNGHSEKHRYTCMHSNTHTLMRQYKKYELNGLSVAGFCTGILLNVSIV